MDGRHNLLLAWTLCPLVCGLCRFRLLDLGRLCQRTNPAIKYGRYPFCPEGPSGYCWMSWGPRMMVHGYTVHSLFNWAPVSVILEFGYQKKERAADCHLAIWGIWGHTRIGVRRAILSVHRPRSTPLNPQNIITPD